MCASSLRAKQRMKEAVLSEPAVCKLLCKAETASCFSQLHYWCRFLLPCRVCLYAYVHGNMCTCKSLSLGYLWIVSPLLICRKGGLPQLRSCHSPSSPFHLSACSPVLSSPPFVFCINLSPLAPPPPPSLSLSGLHFSLTDVLWTMWEGIPPLCFESKEKKKTYLKQRRKKNQTRTKATELPNSAVSKVMPVCPAFPP